jgi:hypothetical protein
LFYVAGKFAPPFGKSVPPSGTQMPRRTQQSIHRESEKLMSLVKARYQSCWSTSDLRWQIDAYVYYRGK